MSARVARCVAGLAAAVALAAGCDSVGPGNRRSLEPRILAVTAPDSLAAGESLYVSVHWEGGGCKAFERFLVDRVAPHDLKLRLRITDATSGACPANIAWIEVVYVFPPPAAGVVRLTVGEAHPIVHMIAVGAAPAAVDRQRIEYEPLPTGSPVAPFAVQWRDWGILQVDTLWFDPSGRAELTLPCLGAPGMRHIDVNAPPYFRDLWFRRRESCGHPQVTKLGAP